MLGGSYKLTQGFLYYLFPIYSQQWILDKQDLIRERQHDLAILAEEEYQKILIFFSNCKSECSNMYHIKY